ncbi:hypothetical protein D9M68_686210 [compost metagenome]
MIGAKVMMWVAPSISTSLKPPPMAGVFRGNTSRRVFITSSWFGCTRILPSALTRKAWPVPRKSRALMIFTRVSRLRSPPATPRDCTGVAMVMVSWPVAAST